MLTAVLSGFLVAILAVPFGKFIRGRWSALVSLVPLSLFLYFLGFIPRISAGETFHIRYPWVPSMGLDLSFYLDSNTSFCTIDVVCRCEILQHRDSPGNR